MASDWEREVRWNQAQRDGLTPAAEARVWRRRFWVALFLAGVEGVVMLVLMSARACG